MSVFSLIGIGQTTPCICTAPRLWRSSTQRQRLRLRYLARMPSFSPFAMYLSRYVVAASSSRQPVSFFGVLKHVGVAAAPSGLAGSIVVGSCVAARLLARRQ